MPRGSGSRLDGRADAAVAGSAARSLGQAAIDKASASAPSATQHCAAVAPAAIRARQASPVAAMPAPTPA